MDQGDWIRPTYISSEKYAELEKLDGLRTDVVRYHEQRQHCVQLLGLTHYGNVQLESVGEHKLFLAFIYDVSRRPTAIKIFDKERA